MNIPREHLTVEPSCPRPIGGQQAGLGPRGVKITHLPTGNIAVCESERSQLRNRELAMEMIVWGLERHLENRGHKSYPH